MTMAMAGKQKKNWRELRHKGGCCCCCCGWSVYLCMPHGRFIWAYGHWHYTTPNCHNGRLLASLISRVIDALAFFLFSVLEFGIWNLEFGIWTYKIAFLPKSPLQLQFSIYNFTFVFRVRSIVHHPSSVSLQGGVAIDATASFTPKGLGLEKQGIA
jgi:hypothetical protein